MPASRRRPAGSTPELDIYVERFSRGSGPSVVYLTGGPGIGLDAYVSLGVVEKMLSSLDGEILLIEQRGNVRSPGKLSCSPGEETAGCLGRLAKEEAHPEDYNTVESADDVVEVLDAFGVARAVIWGHSYGSGLAQFAVKNHPERFLSVVLEGVSSPTTPRASDPVPSRLATLSAFGEWYSKRCETDPMCAAAYPSGIKPAAEVEQLMMNSGNDPNYTIQLVDGQQLLVGDLEAWFLNGLATYDGMLGFSQLVYAHNRATAQDRSSMDGWLTAVGHGDRAAGAKSVRGFADALASITSAASRDVKSCFDLQTFDADPDCAALPRDVYTAATFNLDFRTELPTLFLNGALDTQTLPAETDLVRPRFANLKEVLLPACVGHFSYRDGGACADQVLAGFLSGKASPLPGECSAEAICATLPLIPRFVR